MGIFFSKHQIRIGLGFTTVLEAQHESAPHTHHLEYLTEVEALNDGPTEDIKKTVSITFSTVELCGKHIR